MGMGRWRRNWIFHPFRHWQEIFEFQTNSLKSTGILLASILSKTALVQNPYNSNFHSFSPSQARRDISVSNGRLLLEAPYHILDQVWLHSRMDLVADTRFAPLRILTFSIHQKS
jgi:hypothetical protein